MPLITTDYSSYERQVISWVAEWAQLNANDLSSETCINCGFITGGLGIAGEDGDELMHFLNEKSGVDFGEFQFNRYFWRELGIGRLIVQPWKLFEIFGGPKLTIADLGNFMAAQRAS